MSLDFTITAIVETDVFDRNITHNLGGMANEAGVYYALWHPDEIGAVYAKDITPILEAGLATLKADPARFEALNPKNGWGDCGGLVRFVEAVLEACKQYPDGKIEASV